MEELKKNKLTLLTMFLTVILGCYLTYSLANKSRDDYELNVKIDSKVDKVDFNKHVDENNSVFKDFSTKQDIQLTKIMTKAVFKMAFDCGQAGVLAGIFVTEKEVIEYLISSGIEVYFGEVLGKHSEVFGPVEENEITMVTDDPKVITMFQEFNLSSGYNPLDYYSNGDCFDEEGNQLNVGEYITMKLSEIDSK